MGHAVFLAVHVVALALYPPALVVTVVWHALHATRVREKRLSLHQAWASFQCPNCHWLIPPDSRVCGQCRTALATKREEVAE